MSSSNFLEEHYESYDEDGRFKRDKAHLIEFLITTKYIDRYLKPHDKILEVGAGTGAYSLYYAQKGHEVEALELVQRNVDIFKSKINGNKKVDVRLGDAIDLSGFDDNTFDITLVLGPLYHLYNDEDKKKAISEALRVTKTNGYVFIAYLTHGSIMLHFGLVKGNLLRIKDMVDSEYRFKDDPKEIFTAFYVDEFEKLMKQFSCDHLHSVATDGVATSVNDELIETVDKLSDDEFQIWLDYHLKTCERRDLQGYSSHMLHICKKL